MWYHINEHMVNTETSLINMRRWPWDHLRDNSGYGFSHCETTLHCNVVFYWLNSYPDLFLDLLGSLHFWDRTYSLLFFMNGPFSFQEFVAQGAVFSKVGADWSFMLIWTDVREDGFSFFLSKPFCFFCTYPITRETIWCGLTRTGMQCSSRLFRTPPHRSPSGRSQLLIFLIYGTAPFGH